MRCWKESCVLENLERAVDLCSRRFGPSQVTAQGQMRRRIILVVEDDLDVARLIRYHLEAARFGVAVFPDGNSVVSEAKRLCRSSLFSMSYSQAPRVLTSVGRSEKYPRW